MKKSFIILAVAMFALATAAQADKPVCPCWDGVTGLHEFVSLFSSPRVCDTTPETEFRRSAEGFLLASSVLMTFTEGAITAFSSNSSDPRGRTSECFVNRRQILRVSVTDLSQVEVWACIRDVMDVCRELGF